MPSFKISEGGFGCVYIPPLMCSSRNKAPRPVGKMVVSKVQENKYSKQEIELVEKIRTLPLASHYFLLPEPEICHLNASEKKMVRESCETTEDVPFEKLTQISIAYGGQSLRTAVIDFKSFSLKRFMKHLLEGVSLLKKNNLAHADLHLGNILLGSNNLPLMIDFAKLISFDETSPTMYKTHFLAFLAGYEQIPPEGVLMAGLHTTSKTAEQIIDVIPNMKSTFSLAANYLNYSREEVQSDLRTFLKRFIQENPKTYMDLPTFWRLIAPKFDAYSCGNIFLTILVSFLRSPYFAQRQYSMGRDQINKVIRGLICANPYERLSPEDALLLLN
jgi:serine/threonine protein kinase